MLIGLTWSPSCFAADDTTAAKEKTTAQDVALNPEKKPAEEKSSFKRFEISYGALWINGTFFESDTISGALSGIPINASLKYKNKVSNIMHIKTGVSKGTFFITPRTYVAGSYARTYFEKGRPGSVNLDLSVPGIGTIGAYLEDHISSDRITFWGIDLGQNIFTHKKTGIALDLIAGYYDYTMNVSNDMDYIVVPALGISMPMSISKFFGGKRSFSGAHAGFNLKVPFKLPKFKKRVVLDLGFRGMPSLTMKGKKMFLSIPLAPGAVVGLIPNFTSKGKGYNLEGRAGLTFEITQNVSLEVAYNYYKFKITKGKYGNTVLTGLGTDIPVDVTLQKARIMLQGPSFCAKIKF